MRTTGNTLERVLRCIMYNRIPPCTASSLRKQPKTESPIVQTTTGFSFSVILRCFCCTNCNAHINTLGNPIDVKEAVEHGYPAGCIYPSDYIDDNEDNEIRLAFDFDGVIADDSAESIFQNGALSEKVLWLLIFL